MRKTFGQALPSWLEAMAFATIAATMCAATADAQSVTYHLHNEASTSASLKQLKTAGPDVAQVTLQTSALQGAGTGEKQIAQFDTVTAVPGTAGRIPTGSTVSAVVWMRKTANFGAMFPRLKVRLNSSAGTSLCTATGTTALTTTLTAHSISCTTTANVTLTASDRLYVWAGVNLTTGSSGGAFRGELGVEGTLNGTADSRVDVPSALPAPAISTLSPTAGPIGQVVTISGSHFRNQQLASVVKFHNNKTAAITSWSNTSIVVTVPSGAITGNVTVTVAGLASPGVSFAVGTVPIISTLSPTAGLAGTAVVITGTGFGATKGSSTVKFNGVTATTTSWSATAITATVPASATTGNVVVTVGTVPSAGTPFTVPTLVTLSVVPAVSTVPVKGKQRFTAVGHYSDGVDRNVSAIAAWTSTDGDVATVDVSGLSEVFATSGTTTISATVGASNGVAQLTAAPSKFKAVGSLRTPRLYHAAAPLPDGKVLISGGQDGYSNVTATAEVYDSATGRFTPTGNMWKKRHHHTATTLLDGRVLIVGGTTYFPDEDHASAEIYNPATGTFSFAGSMSVPRLFHTATLLSDGRVLIEQGALGFPYVPSSEIYDPATGTFTVTTPPATVRRYGYTATLLNNGTVLMAGGSDDDGATATTDIYDPVADTYATNPPLAVQRRGHSATRLLDGRLVIVGGYDPCPTSCTAEVFEPGAASFAPTQPLSIGRGSHTATLLPDGNVLLTGGSADAGTTATAELFDPSTLTFTAAGAMATTRFAHTATALPDGSVLLVGGYGEMAKLSAELYLPEPVAPLSLRITPSSATLQVGANRTFQVIDHLSQPRTDADWSTNDAAIATVDPITGVATAIAPGTVTLTATIGASSANATITVLAAGPLPPGTTTWTLAPAFGLTTKAILQGTRSGSGVPSAFAINGNASETQIIALTANGFVLWEVWLPAQASNFVPNKSGGLIATLYNSCDGVNPMRLISIDGPTGIWAWQFVGGTTCGSETPRLAIRPDGAVAVTTPGNLTGFPTFMLLDGITGTSIPVPSIPASTFTSFNGQQTPGLSRVGPAMVDPDGVVHLLYEKRLVGYPPQVLDTGIWLMSVRPDQTWTTTQLSSTTQNTNLFPGKLIPDGHGGVLATWVDSPIVAPGQSPAQSTFRAARVSATGAVTNYDLPLTPPVDLPRQPGSALPVNPELTLGENDTAFVAYEGMLVSFNSLTGGQAWQYTAPAGSLRMVVSDTQDGIFVKNGVGGLESVLRFNSGGGASAEPIAGAALDYLLGLGWMGAGASGAAAYASDAIDVSTAGWFAPTQGNTSAAVPLIKITDVRQNDPHQTAIRTIFQAAKARLEADALLPNPTCSTWFNTGLGTQPITTAAGVIGTLILPDFFVHGKIARGGSTSDGEHVSAFTGHENNDKAKTPVGTLPADSRVSFNRDGAFFKRNYSFYAYNPVRPHKVGIYDGDTFRARLTIALHELAHLLQDTDKATSVVTVKDFKKDGGDPTSQFSTQNTNLILEKCQVMIERP